MRERVTAIQAIMLAGGMKESARSSQILLFRKINSDTAEVKVLNLKRIKRTSDLENDLTLQAGDILLVPRDAISKIERGNSRDIADVKLLVQQKIITLDALDAAYQEVLTQLGQGRYPRLTPQRFVERYAAVRKLL